MGFAEAMEFFKKLVDPSAAIISSLEYRRKLGCSFIPHKIIEDLPFRNLVQSADSSAYIDMELVGGKKRLYPGADQQNLSIPPFINYTQHRDYRSHEKRRRRAIKYKNTTDKVDEPTLEQILDIATVKLSPEDIAKLKLLIKNAAEL